MAKSSDKSQPNILFGLSVKSSDGLGTDLLQNKKQYNAFLGTSLGKALFTKENVQKYFKWAEEYCNKFILVIDDYEERLNYIVFKSLSYDDALERALTFGKGLEKKYNSILVHENISNVSVTRAQKLLETEECKVILSHLLDAYVKDQIFKRDTHSQLFENIKGKIEEWKQTVTEKKYEKDIHTLSEFLLEEIAVTIYLREILGYHIEIYPGPLMQLVKNLYINTYPELTNRLNIKKSNYGFIYLGVE